MDQQNNQHSSTGQTGRPLITVPPGKSAPDKCIGAFGAGMRVFTQASDLIGAYDGTAVNTSTTRDRVSTFTRIPTQFEWQSY